MMSIGAAIVKPDGNRNPWYKNILSVMGNINSTKKAVYLFINKNKPLIISNTFKNGKKSNLRQTGPLKSRWLPLTWQVAALE